MKQPLTKKTGVLWNFFLQYNSFSAVKQFVKFETYTLKLLVKLFPKSSTHQSLIFYFQFQFVVLPYLILYSFLNKKLADEKGLSGRNRLTMEKTDAIQNFFDKVIRKKKGNPQNMSK